MVLQTSTASYSYGTTTMASSSSWDDGSVSSTFSVPQGDANKSSPSYDDDDDDRKCTNKSVTFNMNANESYDNHVICKEELKSLCWYDSSDYKYFRGIFKLHVKTVAQSKDRSLTFSYKNVITRTFRQCSEAINEFDSYQNISSSKTTTTTTVTKDQEHLCQFLMNNDDSMMMIHPGLEKFAVPIMRKERSCSRYEVVDSILDFQVDFPIDQCLDEQDEDEREEIIRMTSEAISRPSRIFAQAMAQAQASALLLAEDNEEKDEMLPLPQ